MHARQFTSGLAHFKACIHDSAPIFSSDFNQLWNVDLFRQGTEQVLSVAEPEVIYAHVRNFISGFIYFAQTALKRWYTSEVFASFGKSELLNPFL